MNRNRAAFTLVELMVALGVVLALAAIVAAVLPGAVVQDRTTDAASTVRQHLMVAKGMAAKDALPRGVWFITGLDPNNPAKTNPNWVTDILYVEAPPVLIANPLQTTRLDTSIPPINPPTPPQPLPAASPHVEVLYTVGAGGAITTRQIFVRKLQPDQANQVEPGAMISVPEFNNYYCTVLTATQAASVPVTNPATVDVEVTVAINLPFVNDYPDDYMGASQQAVSYRFGIYATPKPLVGESTIPLPKNICVDLSPATANTLAPSSPLGVANTIIFAPSGEVISRGVGGQIFLWVRDYTKAQSPLVVTAAGPTYDMNPFLTGGEQQIVALKTKSASLGVFPVQWPDQASGTYAPGQDAYSFARRGATSP